MPNENEQDSAFARAVIRLKLTDQVHVDECMKTVADGDAPNLAEAMVEQGVLDRETADRVVRATRAGEPPPSSSEDPPPVIPGYEIVRKLGEGGMGTVWQARQTSLNRLVAIKVLPAVFSANRKFLERFRREALATAKLNHPHIVAAIDVGMAKGEGGDVHYFVMECVDGESVDDVILRAGKIDPVRAAEIAADVAGALDHAWSEAHIVHRDVKPANILITRAGKVKLADLGLAHTQEDAALTTAGLAIGTPHYASPEQVQGRSEVDCRSDIYALGATLFHMLTGRPVFEGESAAAVMARHVTEDAPLCTDVHPQTPPELAAVVAKMMRRDPDERYQTHGELRVELERFRKGDRPLAYTRMLAAHETGLGQFSSRPPEVFADKDSQHGLTTDRHRGLQAVVAALLLVVIGVTLWFITGNQRQTGLPLQEEPAPAGVDRTGQLAVWFDVSNPDGTVGSGGSFPPGFGPASRIRWHARPNEPVIVCHVAVWDSVSGVEVRLLDTTVDADPTPAGTRTSFPGAGRSWTLPAGARTIVLLTVGQAEPIDRARVAAALEQVSERLKGNGLSARAVRGQTLWYGHPDQRWTRGDGSDAPAEAAALDSLCEAVREAFGGDAALAGAAAACGGS